MAKIIRTAAAGTEESGDLRVTVAPAETLRLILHSTLHAQFVCSRSGRNIAVSVELTRTMDSVAPSTRFARI